MLKCSLISLLAIALLFSTSPAAKAQIGPSGGAVTGIIIGAAAAVVVTGLVVYHLMNHGHNLRGCAESSPGGLQLVNEGNHRSYALTGDIAAIKTGDQVRVSGSKVKSDPNHRQFVVTKLSKDYGACKVASATP